MKNKLFSNLDFKYLILLLFFPLVLIILQLSNISNLKLSFPFKLNNFWQLLTSSYIHQDTFHLLGNMLIYYLFLIFLILIFVDLTKKQKNLWLLFIFMILPIINSVIHIFFNSSVYVNPSCGSSVMISAIICFVLTYNLFVALRFLDRAKSYDKLKIISLFFLWVSIIFVFLRYYLYHIILINNQINMGHIIGIVFGICIAFIYKKYILI